jgi:SsrA-binding protein
VPDIVAGGAAADAPSYCGSGAEKSKTIRGKPKMSENEKVLVRNRKARRDYHILETVEAGIVLRGAEVKSIRQGKVSLTEAHARVRDGEVFVYGMHISPYKQASTHFAPDPMRARKLLLNKQEIRRLQAKTEEKGLALIPMTVYLKKGIVKIELAVARGKKLYDKRRDIAERDSKRDIDRARKMRDV